MKYKTRITMVNNYDIDVDLEQHDVLNLLNRGLKNNLIFTITESNSNKSININPYAIAYTQKITHSKS